MAETARINGLIGSVGLKAPVRVATTTNIVLSGTPAVDDVSLVSGDRVLVKDQNVPSENGIYEVDAGAWTRAPDFDGARDIVTGTAVNVNSGTVNAVTQWRVTNTGKITPGTTALVFARSATALGEDLAATIHAAPNKAAPIDADEFSIWDSVTGLLARVSLANVKATLKAYFDPVYAALAGSASQAFSVGTATAAAHAPPLSQVPSISKHVGEIFMYLGDTAPAGSLIVPVVATNISRTTYAALHAFCAALSYPWGSGDGSTTFGMPYVAADEALVQANGNVRTVTAGEVISHMHSIPASTAGNFASLSGGGGLNTQASTVNTGSTGGTKNLAAGVRVLLCVQYQ